MIGDKRPNIITKDVPIGLTTQGIPREWGADMNDRIYNSYKSHYHNDIYTYGDRTILTQPCFSDF